MQRYNIAVFKQRIKPHEFGFAVFTHGSCVHQNIHTKPFGGFFHRFADISVAHYSQSLAVYLVARKNKRRKNARALPPTLLYKGVILRNFGVVHKNIADNLLGHGVCGVAARIANGNSLFLCGGNINIIIARSKKPYITKARRGVHNFPVNNRFVAENYVLIRCRRQQFITGYIVEFCNLAEAIKNIKRQIVI